MNGPRKFDPEQGPFAPGEQFQKFQIRRLLGRGGHAYVYHGYDQFLDRHIALKVIPDPIERGRDLQRRAQLEARVLCKLQHPNLVHVYDAGTIDGELVYLVMELLEGRTLRDVFREHRVLTVPEVLRLGAQIADGVQAAHEMNAIHRDLKPENVFVQQGNAIKVLDFGIAKLLGASSQTTQKDLLHGTMLYMSPEHLQGLGVTPRSDIYALGTILYEALAGGPPCLLGVTDPTIRELAWIQISRVPTPLDQLVSGVPHYVARGIQRMLAKAPADRYASMAEVAELFRSYLLRLEAENPGVNLASRDLWRPAPSAGGDLDTLAQTRPPFTIPPGEASPAAEAREATHVLSGPVSYPPLTHTLPLNQAAWPRDLGQPVAQPAAPVAPPAVTPAPNINPELVPTRTSAVPLPGEPTPLAADSPQRSGPPRRVWTVIGAAVGMGTVAGLAVAFGVHSRRSAPDQSGQALAAPVVEVEPLSVREVPDEPKSLAAPPPRQSAAAPEPAPAPAPEPVASAPDAQEPEPRLVPSPAPSATAPAASKLAAAPRPKAATNKESSNTGGTFLGVLRDSASNKGSSKETSAGPSSTRLPRPSELPGSGLDDPPSPSNKKARSAP